MELNHVSLAVYPHARGELHAVGSLPGHPGGLSPRPWGTPLSDRRELAYVRFIPTPVGNSTWCKPSCCTRTVYPHARGELRASQTPGMTDDGLSPRPWGTPRRGTDSVAGIRFIPTPVGNSVPRLCRRHRPSVYPHARGELSPHVAAVIAAAGLSPRPWGTRPAPRREIMSNRFIPTPVGNSCAETRSCRRVPVYPHARGELGPSVGRLGFERGLSPRPWGTLVAGAGRLRCGRFIPTPVGNSTKTLLSAAWSAVYPHARGELSASALRSQLGRGLSPRPWGTRFKHINRHAIPRFIPTPVGNSAISASAAARFAVYPHARGELQRRDGGDVWGGGLSPRPWGTLLARRCGLGWRRFIPTPVGNSQVAPSTLPALAVYPHARGELPRRITN